MKIRKINFKDHSILGTIELDFTNKEGKVADTIIIAGENGVGKSFILNSIYNLNNFEYNEYSKIDFEIEISNEEMAYDSNNYIINTQNFVKYLDILSPPSDGIGSLSSRFIEQARIDKNVIENSFKVVYSDVGINFIPHPIDKVTSKDIDLQFSNEISESELSTQISQLLVDIQVTDALELNKWVEKNPEEPVPFNNINSRMKRFTAAFNSIFPSKRYKGIETVDNQRKILFEENGKVMDIGNLSSGEKQIVFRGSFLLKNKETSKGSVVLVDEPEISLHPNWQLKILDFYKKLFIHDNGKQSSQIFVSTHSPFIIHNSNRYKDKVIILKKDKDGKIIVSDEPRYYSWTNEKLVKEAFNVSHVLNDDKVVVLVEGETDEKYFRKCIEIFQHEAKNIEFQWVGRMNEKGNAENTGDNALTNARRFFLSNMSLLKNKLILLYDDDTNKPEENFDPLFICRMNKNENNILYKKGIENLLTNPETFINDYKSFYDEKSEIGSYGEKNKIQSFNKMKLCNYICNEVSLDNQRLLLEKINNEINKIANLVQSH